jgi:hypothetical protein
MPEIESRLKSKCDRLVAAFETDEAGEHRLRRGGIYLMLCSNKIWVIILLYTNLGTVKPCMGSSCIFLNERFLWVTFV